MRHISDSEVPSGAGMRPPADRRPDPMSGPLLGSAALHALALLLAVFGLPWLEPAPPPFELVVPINLVRLAEKTASPSAEAVAPLPQEKATEVSESASAPAVPAPQTPPPQAAPRRAEEKSAPDLLTATEEKRTREAPRPVKATTPDKRPAAKLRRQPLPADDLSVRLEQLARLRQPTPPAPPSPRRQDGSGASDVTAAGSNAPEARDASYGVKDFIRAQVERRWNPDGKMLKGRDWVAAIHVVLRPDGSVDRAEIVDDPRYRAESAYRDFARSARNAVLLSSPLTVPLGEYDLAKDIVLDFHSKQVSQ
jgi:outer membrane biosynthesis protein TonB